MITDSEYRTLKSKYDAYQAALQARFGNGWRCITPAIAATLPPAPSNDDTSAVEVYEWIVNPPARYLAYINEDKRIMTTWTGEILGYTAFGRAYRSNFGDTRVSIDVRGTNGKRYYGTYYKSSGDYCRIKMYTKGV